MLEFALALHRRQGGTGAYETDGLHAPDLIAGTSKSTTRDQRRSTAAEASAV